MPKMSLLLLGFNKKSLLAAAAAKKQQTTMKETHCSTRWPMASMVSTVRNRPGIKGTKNNITCRDNEEKENRRRRCE